MDARAMKLAPIILMAGMLAASVRGETFTVSNNAEFAASVTASKTSAPPHTVIMVPGIYTNLVATGLTGTIRSVSGQISGPQSAEDTIIDSNYAASQVGIALGGGGVALLGLQVRNTLNAIALSASVRSTARNCIFDRIHKVGDGAINSTIVNLYSCKIMRSFGYSLVASASGEIFNNLFVSCVATGIYGGIVYQEGGAGKISGNTIVQCRVDGGTTNVGIINHYSSGGGVTLIQNNFYDGTNRMFIGNYVDAGGNVSNSIGAAAFIQLNAGHGTNAVIGDYRLVPNGPAWSAGVFTNAPRLSATSNTAYDVNAMWYRGKTNNSSGCYWQNPTMIPQLRGGLIL